MTVGFAHRADTAIAAKANPDVKFIGVDQGVCIDAEGDAGYATFACAGDAATLLPELPGHRLAETQPGYLAGIVAASLSKTGTSPPSAGPTSRPSSTTAAAIETAPSRSTRTSRSSTRNRPEPRQAASTTRPGPAFAAQSDSVPGCRRPVPGRRRSPARRPPGRLRQGHHGIGVDVDQAVSPPNPPSASSPAPRRSSRERPATSSRAVATGTFKGGPSSYNSTSRTRRCRPVAFPRLRRQITPEIQAKLDTARRRA